MRSGPASRTVTIARAAASLPLGVDFNDGRVRVALAELDESARPKLVAVATRNCQADAAAALRDAVDELGTNERRCVLGIAPPDAILRVAAFPRMPWRERRRAATFEAARHIDYPIDDAAVSIVALDERRVTLGIARRATLDARLAAARRSRLRPIAVDDVAFAVQRVFGDWDGALDVGDDATRLTVFADPIPAIMRFPVGRGAFIEAVARALGIDSRAADERLRTVGFAGAGEAPRDELIDVLAETLARARAERGDVRRLVLTGDGAQIPLFAETLERGIGVVVRSAELAPGSSDTLPPDVLRAAGAEWTVAFGLTLWATAS